MMTSITLVCIKNTHFIYYWKESNSKHSNFHESKTAGTKQKYMDRIVCWEDSSMGKMLAELAWGPGFEPAATI